MLRAACALLMVISLCNGLLPRLHAVSSRIEILMKENKI
jgi:hypothetical protein